MIVMVLPPSTPAAAGSFDLNGDGINMLGEGSQRAVRRQERQRALRRDSFRIFIASTARRRGNETSARARMPDYDLDRAIRGIDRTADAY